ncbi:hybrid sensor histidine kinase/response regulator [Aliinostoc sp. HNIBRCY26]|uniref:hybrid sensor histidine kinase/response regulator n=1 Tax=Aliinostoc sp. HNIBRCY26 TaxID=3418997 RepID=UPI003D00F7CA
MNHQHSILIIDDEPDNFDVIEILLDSENYELHYAPSGQQAIDCLDSFQPDVILLDVMMPDLDGMEVCRKIKSERQWQTIPIIMVTALTAKEDLAKCMAAGADDFISKPVNGVELRARVNSMLRIKGQYDQLQSLLNLREDMVNMIVHDLRNPLTSIIISNEVLQIPGLSPEKHEQKTHKIILAAQQMQSMIDSLLIMAKLESGKMVLQRNDVELGTLCLSALADVEEIAHHKNLHLVSELPNPGSMVNVDVPIFRRILDNLLSNAIKFSPPHSQVILKAECSTTDTKLQVIDSGSGVPQNLRQSIFEKYEIGTRMSEVSQIGLGLAFCKMAIEAHHGMIMVEDNYPQGSVFTIFLPSI